MIIFFPKSDNSKSPVIKHYAWFLVFFIIFPFQTKSQVKSNLSIYYNQLGYYSHSPKEIYFSSSNPISNDSRLFQDKTGKEIYRSPAFPIKTSFFAGLNTVKADFTQFSGQGKFYLDFALDSKMGKLRTKEPFLIRNGVYHSLAIASLKAFYFQRASMPLLKTFAGDWARAAGHPDNRVFIHSSAISPGRPEGYILDASGGWYDAGDYNKYVVNSGITVGTLLSAYEDFPKYFDSLRTNIPESGNSVPDILDETLYNIRWMLKMQDPYDGGVYHKCTNAEFDPMVMPEKAQNPRYLVQKGTAASLDFAAVMAQSARVFLKFEKAFPGLSDSCLRASGQAWEWALRNPHQIYDQSAMNNKYSPAIHTGEYGDNNMEDEFFWAASELYVTEKVMNMDKDLKGLSEKIFHNPDQTAIPSWSNVGMLGYYSLLRFREIIRDKDNSLPLEEIKDRVMGFAEKLVNSSKNNGVMGSLMGGNQNDFVWGSNSVAANQGILMLNAYRMSSNQEFLIKANQNLNYLLGTNPTGYCFVTGFGILSPMHPHHRPSISDGIMAPVPGLLVGGPNPGRQDGKIYRFTEPETSYTDQDGAYASNEIAINWNAPLVYLVNGLEFYQSHLSTLNNPILKNK